MGVLWDDVGGYAVLQLVGRGLRPGQIDRAMKKMVGSDWSGVRVSEWRKRLQDKGFTVHDEAGKFLDDLEALITGATKLDDLQRYYACPATKPSRLRQRSSCSPPARGEARCLQRAALLHALRAAPLP